MGGERGAGEGVLPLPHAQLGPAGGDGGEVCEDALDRLGAGHDGFALPPGFAKRVVGVEGELLEAIQLRLPVTVGTDEAQGLLALDDHDARAGGEVLGWAGDHGLDDRRGIAGGREERQEAGDAPQR